MSADSRLAPVRKLDPATVLAAVNATARVDLDLVGLAPGGEVGAAYVRWPDGTEGVLSWRPGGADIDAVRRTADVLELVRSRGLPVPSYDLIVELPDDLGIAVVQERLPGVPAGSMATAGAGIRRSDVIRAMVELNERFAGLLATRPDVPPPALYLQHSGPGFCIHESLQTYDSRTRRLLGWIREVGRQEPATPSGDDLVHLDFHTGNVLVDSGGQITGVIDWDGIARGDRRFALVTMRFDLAVGTGPFGSAVPGERDTSDPATIRWLDTLLETSLAPETLRLYWAHMSLRMVDWAIRHYSAAEVEHWCGFAETRMD